MAITLNMRVGSEWYSILNAWVLEQSLTQLLDPDLFGSLFFFFTKHIMSIIFKL